LTALLLALLLDAPPTVAVLPPDRLDSGPETLWVSEAVADMLPRALGLLGVPVVDRSDRLRVQETLGIPRVPLTRATSIRIASVLGASRLVVGTYEMKAEGLTLGLKTLDTERGTLSAPFMSTGPPEKFLASLYGLAWDIALSGPTPSPKTRADFLAQAPKVSFDALRAYGQGLGAGDPKSRVKLLKRALALDPTFDEARLALGRLELDEKESEAARLVLSQVRSESLARQARFLEGVALLGLGRYKEAEALYGELAKEKASPAVLNNQAVALLRLEGRPKPASVPLKAAVEAAPGATDLVYNLGFALLVEGEPEAAAFWLRGVVREAPDDSYARLLLVWALRKAKRDDEANEEWKALMGLQPTSESLATPDFSRRFERVLPGERIVLLDPDRRSDAELARGLIARAEELVPKDADEALRELGRAEALDPCAPGVHHAMARAYLGRGAKDQAAEEFHRALWCKEEVPVRLELMLLLKDLGKAAEARAEAARILKVDPQNEAARKLIPPD
jgi:Tfp pilus assembly protein PilF